MKIRDYKESVYTNVSLEKINTHSKKVKDIYTYRYNAEYINAPLKADNLADILNTYTDNKYKFITYSHTYTETPERDMLTKEAIFKGKIFIKSYGNDETKAFSDDDWITVLGVWKNNGKWIVENYVNDDLSKITNQTFAVSRIEDNIPRTSLSGTSFDQPYLAQICNKIASYYKLNYDWDMTYNDMVEYLKEIGTEIEIKGHKITLVTDNVEFIELESDTDMIILDSQITKNFKISDIACKDKNKTVLINEDVIAHTRRLQKFREWYSRPMIVNSWYRTAPYNKSIGGEDNSFHMKGIATDVLLPNEFMTFTRERKNEFLNNIKAKWYAICKEDGVAGGVGFYDTFFHLDSRPTNQAFWDKRGVK